ncbi:hypothetical protein Tco_1578277 [Tanacetum coccineum]
MLYEHSPYGHYDSSNFDQPSQYTHSQPPPYNEISMQEILSNAIFSLDESLKRSEHFSNERQNSLEIIQLEIDHIQEMVLKTQMPNPQVDLEEPEGSDKGDTKTIMDELHNSISHIIAHVPPPSLAYIPPPLFLHTIDKEMSKPDILFTKPLGNLTMGDEVVSIITAREIDEFKTSYASDLVPIPRESEVTMSSVDGPFRMTLDTPPSPYLVVLEDEKIDLLLRENLYTLLMRDREIDFNPCRDIEELECLLVDDPIPIPREFEDSMSSVDHICDSSDVAINDPQFEIVTPLPIFQAKFCLREVERFDPFLSLTRSGETKWVMDLDLKKDIDDMKLQMNEIMQLIRERYQIHEPPISFDETKGSDDDTKVIFDEEKILRQQNALLMGNDVISTTPARENDKFIKSSVDDLVPIPREFEATLVSTELEGSLPMDTPPSPRIDVLGGENFDVDLHLGEHLVNLLMKDKKIDLPRKMVRQILMSRSFGVTISNPLFDFDDNYTLRIDSKNFDDNFEDLCSLDPLKSTPLIDESILLVTPLPDAKQICLREVEIFDHFFPLTQSGFPLIEKTFMIDVVAFHHHHSVFDRLSHQRSSQF